MDKVVVFVWMLVMLGTAYAAYAPDPGPRDDRTLFCTLTVHGDVALCP